MKHALVTGTLYPGLIFVIFCVLNTLIWHEKSSGAVPFGTFFLLVFLWFGVSVPLVYAGAYHALRSPTGDAPNPTRTNKIPRQVPKQAWYMSDFVQVLVGGVLPFGAIFIELFFIMTSLWLHQFYYIFGFRLVFVILCQTCAETPVMLCYFQLVAENHRWWWRAFGTSASSAPLPVRCHHRHQAGGDQPGQRRHVFGYLFIGSALFFAMTGAVGSPVSVRQDDLRQRQPTDRETRREEQSTQQARASVNTCDDPVIRARRRRCRKYDINMT